MKPFEVLDPDWKTSPFTGVTRKHWIECGKHILSGAFSHLKSSDDPLIFPKVPGKTYPWDPMPEWQYGALCLEGTVRTMNIAAPLLAIEPNLTLHGIKVGDYYKKQLLRLFDPASPQFTGRLSHYEAKARAENPKQTGSYGIQLTCELGCLAVNMLRWPGAIWDGLTPAEKQIFADAMSDTGHQLTRVHNWRYFNVMMLTFLKVQGYSVDDELLESHLDSLLMLYGGDGWFRDHHFDFYSVWVFQLYGVTWARAWGDAHDPARVKVIERHFRDLMSTYGNQFSRDGKMLMWGRSICYRAGAGCAFPLVNEVVDSGMDPGWARRIASGILLQFTTHPQFFHNSVPSLGFYGHSENVLQMYSCSASPFWMFGNFVALAQAADSPFWTATETEGNWPEIGRGAASVMLPGPGLQLTQHGLTGTAELRAAKVHGRNPNYSRLCYNTHFPWEDVDPNGATAGDYSIRNLEGDETHDTGWNLGFLGEKDGVLYRQLHIGTDTLEGSPTIDLADIPIPGGVIRIDRLRIHHPLELRLGHFGLPHLSGPAQIGQCGDAVTTAIPGRRLALKPLYGWSSCSAKVHAGCNAEAEESTVSYLELRRDKPFPRPEIVACLMLHRCDDEPWTEQNLNIVESLEIIPYMSSGNLLGARLKLTTGESYLIDFGDTEGCVQN